MPDASISGAAALRQRRRRRGRLILAAVLAVWLGVAFWQTHKPLPPGTHVMSPWYPDAPAELSFMADITAADAYGRPVLSQEIFDHVLTVVRSARQFIVLDYFLMNGAGTAPEGGPPLRPLSSQLRDALIEQKKAVPGLQILFITDPVNEVYGGEHSQGIAALRAAGIEVVVTNLDVLRDSNFLYSSLWRIGLQWWSGRGGPGWLPDPLDEGSGPISASAWARLLNFKANHRKVIIADDGHGGLRGIIASANPHDASSAHSNVALEVSGAALEPLLASELAIARFSGWRGTLPGLPAPAAAAASSASSAPPPGALPLTRVRILTEGAIRDELLEQIDGAGRGDSIDIAMFYLSSRPVIEALIAASRRGAAVRLILDPNKDAFGHEKNGIPNRPAASELVSASDGAIQVRWYRTHGEQFHSKLVMVYGAERLWLTLGSANLTRRNLDDYNLEANVAVETSRESPLARQMLEYFDTLWNNRAPPGTEYTTDVSAYADPSQLHYWAYRLMEATGLATF